MKIRQEPNHIRCKGRTTLQLINLPKGSVFIVPNRNMKLHAKILYHELRRDKLNRDIDNDLIILTLDDCFNSIKGRSIPAWDYDHSMILTDDQYTYISSIMIPAMNSYTGNYEFPKDIVEHFTGFTVYG